MAFRIGEEVRIVPPEEFEMDEPRPSMASNLSRRKEKVYSHKAGNIFSGRKGVVTDILLHPYNKSVEGWETPPFGYIIKVRLLNGRENWFTENQIVPI